MVAWQEPAPRHSCATVQYRMGDERDYAKWGWLICTM
jgi:hypothetical protein